MKINPICFVIGHNLGDPVPVHTNILDHIGTTGVANIMNGARAKYGLPPISWED